MNVDISKIFEAFIELNKVKSLAPGETSGSLARSIDFYKKRIVQINKIQPEIILPLLIKSHVELATVKATTSQYSHMLGSSIYFLERLIALSFGKYSQDIKESNDITNQGNELTELMKKNSSDVDNAKINKTIEILKDSIRYHRRFMAKSYATDSEIENCKESIYSCIYSIRLLKKILEN